MGNVCSNDFGTWPPLGSTVSQHLLLRCWPHICPQTLMKTNTKPLDTTCNTWCVNDVYVVILPHGVRRSGLDGDAPLSLQLHRVHGGSDAVLPLHLHTAEDENSASVQTVHLETSPDYKHGAYKHGASRRSPRGCVLFCRCKRGHARLGWSSPSRCEPRSRCCGSSRWERYQRRMSDNCWWEPTETSQKETHIQLSVYRLWNAMSWWQIRLAEHGGVLMSNRFNSRPVTQCYLFKSDASWRQNMRLCQTQPRC